MGVSKQTLYLYAMGIQTGYALLCGGYSMIYCERHAIHLPIFFDDVIKWKQFPRYSPFVTGIHRSLVDSPHKGHRREALLFYICTWTNDWANNRDANDLRRHRTHDDVTVIVRVASHRYREQSGSGNWPLSPALLQWFAAVALLSANGGAAFNENWAPIG